MTPFSVQNIKSLERFQARLLTRPPKLILLSSILLLGFAGIIVAALILVPWRQTVIGQGEVSIFNPLDRPQSVDAQIKGRLVELMVQEGDVVKKGQIIATLEDRDTKYLDPAQSERIAGQIEALEEKKLATLSRLEALNSQLDTIDMTRVAKQNSVSAKVTQQTQKLDVYRQQLRMGEQDVVTAKLQEERIRALEEAGLKSRRDLELSIQKRVEAEVKLQKMRGELRLYDQDITLSQLEKAKIDAEAAEKRQKVMESTAKARENIAEIEEKLEKLKSEAGALSVRRSLQQIVAPTDGRIVNLQKLGLGQLVKEGQNIAYVVPETEQLGVELYLSGIDAPLVEKGVTVRLMFEGFPAVPFAGWDWASVGTFGGVVTSIDPVNTENGKQNGFRVWVLPDPDAPAWPDHERLRLGAKVNGWLQLNQVPLYYELWRQLNAFPAQPTVVKKPKIKPVIRR